jgi:hypothetical protein
MMLASGTFQAASRVAAASAREVIIKVRSGGIKPSRRSTACVNSGLPPKSAMNCLGRALVLSGQKRSPRPPARMTA